MATIATRWTGHDLPGQFIIRQPLPFGRYEDWPGIYPTIREAVAAIMEVGALGADVVENDVIVWPSRARSKRLTAGKDGRP